MQRYFSSLKHKLPTSSLQNSYRLIQTQKNFFSNSKETQYTKHTPSESAPEINTDLTDVSTIEAEPIENPIDNEFKITDMYTIKSKKLGDPNIKKLFDATKFQHNNVKLRVYNKEDYTKDAFKNSQLIPISPKLGPFEINDPVMESKTYHWCSCGLSNKQPFCDGSHKNTQFKPISFKLGEKCESMSLCGCKLSKITPFCDGTTCVELKKKEEEEIKTKIENLNLGPK